MTTHHTLFNVQLCSSLLFDLVQINSRLYIDIVLVATYTSATNEARMYCHVDGYLVGNANIEHVQSLSLTRLSSHK